MTKVESTLAVPGCLAQITVLTTGNASPNSATQLKFSSSYAFKLNVGMHFI